MVVVLTVSLLADDDETSPVEIATVLLGISSIVATVVELLADSGAKVARVLVVVCMASLLTVLAWSTIAGAAGLNGVETSPIVGVGLTVVKLSAADVVAFPPTGISFSTLLLPLLAACGDEELAKVSDGAAVVVGSLLASTVVIVEDNIPVPVDRV